MQFVFSSHLAIQSQIYHFHFSMDCSWTQLTLWIVDPIEPISWWTTLDIWSLSFSWLNGPSLPGPSNMPEVVFQKVYNSPLQMVRPCSKIPKAHFMIFSLKLNTNYTWHIFPPEIIPKMIWSARPCGPQAVLLALRPDTTADSFSALGSTQRQQSFLQYRLEQNPALYNLLTLEPKEAY